MSAAEVSRPSGLRVENRSVVQVWVKVTREESRVTFEDVRTAFKQVARDGGRDETEHFHRGASKQMHRDASARDSHTLDSKADSGHTKSHGQSTKAASKATGRKWGVSLGGSGSHHSDHRSEGFSALSQSEADSSKYEGELKAHYGVVGGSVKGAKERSTVDTLATVAGTVIGSVVGSAVDGLKVGGSFDSRGVDLAKSGSVLDTSEARVLREETMRKGAVAHDCSDMKEAETADYGRGVEQRDFEQRAEGGSHVIKKREFGERIAVGFQCIAPGTATTFAMYDDSCHVAFVSAFSEFGQRINENWRTVAKCVVFNGEVLSDEVPDGDCFLKLADFKRGSIEYPLVELKKFDFDAVLSDWKLSRYKDALAAEGMDDVEYWRRQRVRERYILSVIGMKDACCDKFQGNLQRLRKDVLTLNVTVSKVELGVIGTVEGVAKVKKLLERIDENRAHAKVRAVVSDWIEEHSKCGSCAERGSEVVVALESELPRCGQCKMETLSLEIGDVKKDLAKAKQELDSRIGSAVDSLTHGITEVKQELDSRIGAGIESLKKDLGDFKQMEAQLTAVVSELAKVRTFQSWQLLNERTADGCPQFLAAIGDDNFEKFQFFWKNRRKVAADAVFKYWRISKGNALHWAAKHNRVDVIKHLIADGTLNVNGTDDSKQRRTALIVASRLGHIEAVKLLLAVDTTAVDKKESDGWNALMYAGLNGSLPIVKALVEMGGASLSLRTTKGRTALDIAKERKHATVVEYLESK